MAKPADRLQQRPQAPAGPGPRFGPGPMPKERPKDWFGTLLKVWAYLSVHKRMLIVIFVMVVSSSLLGLLGPYLVGAAIDHLTEYGADRGLLILIALLGAVYVLHSLTMWLQNYWMVGIAQKAVYTMRGDLFNHLHKLPIPFFNKRRHGELMSRLTNDIDNVSQTLNSSFIQLSSSILTFVGMLAMMIWLSPLLTLVTLTIVPLMFFGMKWITNRTGRLFKEQQKYLGEVNGFIEETFSGQKIVKAFSQEDRVIEEFLEKSGKLRTAGYWAQTYSGFIPKLMNMLNNFSFAIIAGAGGLLALNGLVSIGVIVTFTEYSRQFTRPLNDLANQFNTFLSAVAGAERVFDIMAEDVEEQEDETVVAPERVRGEIEFSQVGFSYEKGGDTLKNISFRANPGETVALVGPTGAGKTTVVSLLTRFYDCDSGVIRIDGIDIKQWKRSALRRQMGFVLQDPFLFHGTIRENIRYGRLNASDREVEEAAKQANAHSFIMKLPAGYDTVIDAEGSGISQGQKQLLTIARAILADPVILILDEATSSIDTVTEIKIQEALQRLMKGRTSIVIAHRLTTVQQADKILVLKDGAIIERGSHEDLLRQKGFYYDLYHSQFQEFAPEENEAASS